MWQSFLKNSPAELINEISVGDVIVSVDRPVCQREPESESERESERERERARERASERARERERERDVKREKGGGCTGWVDTRKSDKRRWL